MIAPTGLLSRWRALWSTVATADGDHIFDDLVTRYTEPHRAYHNLEHIQECLDHLDAARHLADRPIEVELAIWFHDAIYDPRRSDNEQESALLARARLQSIEAEALAMRVADLIRLTTHGRDTLTGDEAIFCDVDLAILGAEPWRFDQYDTAIRREYDWVSEDVYRLERGRVLARFLNRPHIYRTPYFHDNLEVQARVNLRRATARYE